MRLVQTCFCLRFLGNGSEWNKIQKNIRESDLCSCFMFGIRIRTALTNSYVKYVLVMLCTVKVSYLLLCAMTFRTCDMTHSYAYVTHVLVTWLMHRPSMLLAAMCNHSSYVWHDLFIYDACTCDMTRAQAKYLMAAVALIEEAEQVKNGLDSMNESRHMNESCHTYEEALALIFHTYEWVKSCIWMSHVMHMNESRQPYKKIWHTHEWVTVAIWKDMALSSLLNQCHVIHMSHTYECEYGTHMAHIWTWHTHEYGTHMNMAHIWIWHTYEHGTHMNMAHIWTWHTREHGTHMNMAHTWIWHTHEYGTHMNDEAQIQEAGEVMWESCHTYEWVISHKWMSRGAHMNESCHTCEWVMPHIWMSDATHMNVWISHVIHVHESRHVGLDCRGWRGDVESCHTYELVVSHVWISHVTQMHESCHTHAWVTSLGPWLKRLNRWCVSHVTHLNGSCHTYEWFMSHIWMSRITRMNESYHTYEWVMSHLWMSHVTFMNGSCYTDTNMNESCHTYACVISHLWMSHVTRMN